MIRYYGKPGRGRNEQIDRRRRDRRLRWICSSWSPSRIWPSRWLCWIHQHRRKPLSCRRVLAQLKRRVGTKQSGIDWGGACGSCDGRRGVWSLLQTWTNQVWAFAPFQIFSYILKSLLDHQWRSSSSIISIRPSSMWVIAQRRRGANTKYLLFNRLLV